MRIIGGQFNRRIIRVPAGLPVRPTTDMAKEALFNILSNHFEFQGLEVLDLFAGTGSISLEFVSRGAVRVVSVDSHHRCFMFLREMASQLSAGTQKVIKADVFKFLGRATGNYDIVFADPPYDLERMRGIPEMVFEQALVKAGGWLIMEHPVSIRFDDHPRFFRISNYSKVHFSFFQA